MNKTSSPYLYKYLVLRNNGKYLPFTVLRCCLDHNRSLPDRSLQRYDGYDSSAVWRETVPKPFNLQFSRSMAMFRRSSRGISFQFPISNSALPLRRGGVALVPLLA